MPNQILWDASLVSRSTVLTTELNSLANASRTNVGSEINNGSNLDRYGWLELSVDFVSAPSAGGHCLLYMIPAYDATNYADGSSSLAPGANLLTAIIPVAATTAAQRVVSTRFELPPCKIKFILENQSGQAFPASGSTVTLYTANEEVQ